MGWLEKIDCRANGEAVFGWIESLHLLGTKNVLKKGVQYNIHTLRITTKNKSVQEEFSDESLADFPGRTGTKNTIKKLRSMIRSLND